MKRMKRMKRILTLMVVGLAACVKAPDTIEQIRIDGDSIQVIRDEKRQVTCYVVLREGTGVALSCIRDPVFFPPEPSPAGDLKDNQEAAL